MTRAEQEAFEKWLVKIKHPVSVMETSMTIVLQSAFLAGYRAGFEAQHYDIEDVSKEKVEQ